MIIPYLPKKRFFCTQLQLICAIHQKHCRDLARCPHGLLERLKAEENLSWNGTKVFERKVGLEKKENFIISRY